MTLVDTHTHVIAGDETRYPLRPSGVGSDWYREAPCTVEELAALTAGAGVDAAVLVQAFGPYADDNSYVVDAAAAYPGRFVSVVVVDAEHPDAPARLRAPDRRAMRSAMRPMRSSSSTQATSPL